MTAPLSAASVDELRALLARVEGASGGDAKLDAALKLVAAAVAIAGGMSAHETREAFGGLYDTAPPYTSSIDAALALKDRVLPGWRACVDTGDPSRAPSTVRLPFAHLEPNLDNDDGWAKAGPTRGQAATPPLAIIAAVLHALIATQESRR